MKEQLSYEERLRLVDILNYYRKKSGGETKWLLEKDKLIEGYENEVLLERDIEKQQYLIGKSQGVYLANPNKHKDIRRDLNDILRETKAEEDHELYKLIISNLTGQLSGVQESEELYDFIKEKNIPILFIVYLESKEFLYQVQNEYLIKYYYELKEIHNIKVNSFIIAHTVQEFIQYLREADYDKFDVRVKIYGDSKESSEFCNRSDENKDVYDYMLSKLQKKIYFLTYTNTIFKDKDKNVTAVSILSEDGVNIPEKNDLIDYYYTISYIQALKNRIDMLDVDKLIKFQKLGSYYIYILTVMLNRCIAKKQMDWKFISIILGYDRQADIEKDASSIHEIETIMGTMIIDEDKFQQIKALLREWLF